MKRGLGKNLEDHVILITGGGTGIGAATAIECARAGMDVCVVGQRTSPLERVANQVAELGRRSEVLALDVAETGAAARMLDHVDSTFGRCDAVFANAGYGTEKPIASMEEDEIRRMIEVNLIATVFLLREAARRFIQRKQRGHLLACSSCLAKFTMPRFGLYSATKAGQNLICRSMRLECREFGIEVSSVHPIATHTEFVEVARGLSGDHAGLLAKEMPEKGLSGLFLQRPERVARAVVKGLRRPRSEIWTSVSMRMIGGLVELCPPLYDLMMHLIDRQARRSAEKA